jgi:hypothetical protein
MPQPIETGRALGDQNSELKTLYEQMSQASLFPFWAGSTDVQHDEIRRLMASNRRAVAHIWSYADTLEPLLRRSADLVSMSDSERRSLILMNPGLASESRHAWRRFRLQADPRRCAQSRRGNAQAVGSCTASVPSPAHQGPGHSRPAAESGTDCLASITSKYPTYVRWTISFEGRALGDLAARGGLCAVLRRIPECGAFHVGLPLRRAIQCKR